MSSFSQPRNLLIYSPRMGSIGGIETHLVLLATHMARSGWRVRFMTTTNSLNPSLRQMCLDAGVDMRELPLPLKYSWRAARILWLVLVTLRNRLTGPWSVIYTNAQGSLARIVWHAAGRHTRIIHHHHTSGDASEQATWNRGFRRVLQEAPELVACSRKTGLNVEQAVGRHDIRIMPYLTNPLFEPGEIQDGRPHGTPLHFGYVGRLVSTKGIELICELSHDPRLANIHWHIHGEGECYPASFFERHPQVTYHGRYSGRDAYRTILKNLDATVLFSTHSEGMPLSLIEAMSAGLPWIASDRGGTSELMLAPDNCRLLSPVPSVAEASAAVLDLATAIESGRTSRVAQSRAFQGHFSHAVVARRWQEYFTQKP